MKIKPLGNRVIVQPTPKEEITSSGIILPETINKESRKEGKIMALGSGQKIKELTLKKDQKIIFSEFGGSEIKIGGEEYKILNHDDLLAVIE